MIFWLFLGDGYFAIGYFAPEAQSTFGAFGPFAVIARAGRGKARAGKGKGRRKKGKGKGKGKEGKGREKARGKARAGKRKRERKGEGEGGAARLWPRGLAFFLLGPCLFLEICTFAF